MSGRWTALLLVVGVFVRGAEEMSTESPTPKFRVHYCCYDLSYFNDTTGMCDVRESDAQWRAPWQFRNGSKVEIQHGTSFVLLTGYPSCSSYLYRPEKDPHDEFLLLPNGDLYFPFFNTTVSHEEACLVEVARPPEKDADKPLYYAVVCQDSIAALAPPKDMIAQPVKHAIYVSAMFVSDLFFLLTFIVYLLIPELRNIQGKCLMSTILALFMSYLLFIIVNSSSHNFGFKTCVGMGLFLHYWMMAAFFWMNVLSFNVWWTLKSWGQQPTADSLRRFLYFSVYGWGGPLLVTLAAIIIDFSPTVPEFVIKPNLATTRCWFTSRAAELAYFFGPMTALLALNLIFFILSAATIFTKLPDAHRLQGKGQNLMKKRWKMCMKIFVIMGVTWIFEILQFYINTKTPVWILFDLINMLQGLFIFIVVVLCEKRVLIRLRTIVFSNRLSRSYCPWCLPDEPEDFKALEEEEDEDVVGVSAEQPPDPNPINGAVIHT